jgi:hypothetical protein
VAKRNVGDLVENRVSDDVKREEIPHVGQITGAKWDIDDPFLMVEVAGHYYIIERWDEPGFTGR